MLVLVALNNVHGVDTLQDPKIQSREVPLGVRQSGLTDIRLPQLRSCRGTD